MFQYRVVDPKYKASVKKTSKSIVFNYPSKDPCESSPYLVVLPQGRFKIECWGSLGYHTGCGAYTSGILNVQKSLAIYLYIGSYIPGQKQAGSPYNGGGSGDRTGGGATDVRLISGEWDDFISLKSRIMVAAGGGGHDCEHDSGYGGRINGLNAKSYNPGLGATQTSGGKGFISGKFGIGGSYNLSDGFNDHGGGGGGGYYGGGTGSGRGNCGGGGGSSFISGYPECNAINALSTEDNITHTNQPIHYSGIFFENSEMIEGHSEMPLKNGTTGLGNKEEGAVRISSETRIRYAKVSCSAKIRDNNLIIIYIIIVVVRSSR